MWERAPESPCEHQQQAHKRKRHLRGSARTATVRAAKMTARRDREDGDEGLS